MFLSDKIVSKEKLTFIEQDSIVESGFDTAKIWNTFFSNILINLRNGEYANCDPISDNIDDPVFSFIIKYINRPSILKIGKVCNRQKESLI